MRRHREIEHRMSRKQAYHAISILCSTVSENAGISSIRAYHEKTAHTRGAEKYLVTTTTGLTAILRFTKWAPVLEFYLDISGGNEESADEMANHIKKTLCLHLGVDYEELDA